jgi:hypothetical protein
VLTPELVDPWLGPTQYAEDFYSGGDAPLRHISALVDPSSLEGDGQEHENDTFALPGQQTTDGMRHDQPDEILDVDAEDWSTIQERHGKIEDLYHGLADQDELIADHGDISVNDGSGTRLFESHEVFSHQYVIELAPQDSGNIWHGTSIGIPPSNPDLLTGGTLSFAVDNSAHDMSVDMDEPNVTETPRASRNMDLVEKPNVEETLPEHEITSPTVANTLQEQVVHAEPLGTMEVASSPPPLPLDPVLAGEGKEPLTPLVAEPPANQDTLPEPDAFSVDVGPDPESVQRPPPHPEPSSTSGISRARRPTLRNQMPEVKPMTVQPTLSDTPNPLPTPLTMAIPQARLDDLLTSVRRGDLDAAAGYFPPTPGVPIDQPAWPTDLPEEPALDGAASTFAQPVEELLAFIVANNIEAFDQPAESTGGGHFGYDYAVEEAVATITEKTGLEGADVEVQSVDSSYTVNENSTSYEVEERTTTVQWKNLHSYHPRLT